MQINDEDWEKFAVDVLYAAGFEIVTTPSFGADGGKDFVVKLNNITYIVSCKHYIGTQKHVGVTDESDIVDRMIQHKATGFVGFYSTGITAKLQERLEGICNDTDYNYLIFDKEKISLIMQGMDSRILYNYGISKNLYYMNVSKESYKPLKCMICGKDILEDKRIPYSLAGLGEMKDGSVDFIYGCKGCWLGVKFYLGIFMEIEQALHIEQLLGFDDLLDGLIEEEQITLCSKFYKHKNKFEKRIRQRQYPQNYGTWYGL